MNKLLEKLIIISVLTILIYFGWTIIRSFDSCPEYKLISQKPLTVVCVGDNIKK